MLASNISLESLGISRAVNKPFVFITTNENYSNQAMNIANEFNLSTWILGSGYEYRRLDYYSNNKPFFIVPIDFPSKPNVVKPMSDLQY